MVEDLSVWIIPSFLLVLVRNSCSSQPGIPYLSGLNLTFMTELGIIRLAVNNRLFPQCLGEWAGP